MPGTVKAKTIFISLAAVMFLMLLFPGPIHAMEVEYPGYTGFVNDFAGILDNASASDLEALITSIEKNTGAEIAVVTVKNLQGITIEEYAVELFEKWGIGKADEDNGLLILVALEERQVRIEVGYGLEGIITDLEAGRIIDEIIVPNFKEGQYNRGIYDAVVTISNQVYGEEDLAPEGEGDTISPTASRLSAIPMGCWCCFPVFLFFALIIFLVNLFKRRCPRCRRFWALTIKTEVLKSASYTSSGKKRVERSCRYCSFHDEKIKTIPRRTRTSSRSSGGWSGGSSGGSFGGFGGGSSGGGGASGSW